MRTDVKTPTRQKEQLQRGTSFTVGGAVAAAAPATLGQALELLSSHRLRPIAGGTDLVVRNRKGAGIPIDIGDPPLFIGHLSELKELRPAGAGPNANAGEPTGSAGSRPAAAGSSSVGPVSIGAAVTLTQLQRSPQCPPALSIVIPEFASPAVRSFATVGGNICNASPAADLLPPLYAHGAAVELASTSGSRTMPIGEFITGPGTTAIAAGELMTRIEIPDTAADYRFYRKVASRRANALSKLSVYVAARTRRGQVQWIGIALGAVAPTVVHLPAADYDLFGLGARELVEAAPEVIRAYDAGVNPIDDQRSRAGYRRRTALRLLEFVLTEDLPAHLAAPGQGTDAGGGDSSKPSLPSSVT